MISQHFFYTTIFFTIRLHFLCVIIIGEVMHKDRSIEMGFLKMEGIQFSMNTCLIVEGVFIPILYYSTRCWF